MRSALSIAGGIIIALILLAAMLIPDIAIALIVCLVAFLIAVVILDVTARN